MIKILLNTIALDPNRWTPDKRPYFDLEQLLDPVVDSGFYSLEVWPYHLSSCSIERTLHIKQQARRLGLSFEILSLYPLLHLDGEERSAEWQRFEQLLLRASLLEMNALKLFVGRKASSNITQNEYNRSVDFLSQMVGRASEIGMQVFGEMHENTLFDSVEGCFRVLKDLNHPNLRICFQPYDFTDTARMLADYECVSEYVSHIHFQGRRRGAFVDLCHAELDYPSLFDTMATHTFAGYACLEFVKGCVVPSADLFNLDVVLQSAIRDRDYLTRQFALRGL